MLASSEALGGLDARGMSCARGIRPLFADVAVRVPRGTAAVLLGPNGSGKSTLLRALAGLHDPVAGEVRWDGEAEALRSATWRSRLAYAGHRSGHKDDLSTEENLALACELEHAGATAAERALALERVGLARRRSLPVKRLSQGQKQRLTLARLMLSRRPLWLLDEPGAALDADARGLLGEILREHLDRGGSVVVATHDAIDLSGREVAELRLG